jgi:hypothetical protein
VEPPALSIAANPPLATTLVTCGTGGIDEYDITDELLIAPATATDNDNDEPVPATLAHCISVSNTVTRQLVEK